MKALVLIAILSLTLSPDVLADGRDNSDSAAFAVQLMVSEGIECLHNAGWIADSTMQVPRENSPAIQFAIGRCVGIFDTAIVHSELLLPEELYEQQLGLYLVTLRPSLVGYADCLATDCPDLEARIEAVNTTRFPVYRVLRDVVIDDDTT